MRAYKGLMAEQPPNPQSDENQELDREGIPDLEGALESKEITGDDQEGVVPPRDYPQARRRINRRDTLEEGLAEEDHPALATPREEVPRLVDPDATGDSDDVALGEVGDEGGAVPAEEAAIHVTENPPGAVRHSIDPETGMQLSEE